MSQIQEYHSLEENPILKHAWKKSKPVKYLIRVRIRHKISKAVVKDYGTFREMYAKYKDTHQFWCGDYPPTQIGSHYGGYRLDANVRENMKYIMKRYARRKAWIQPGLRVNGMPVILVWNAVFKRYQCHRCDRRFFTAKSRMKHEQGFHGKPSGKFYVRNR